MYLVRINKTDQSKWTENIGRRFPEKIIVNDKLSEFYQVENQIHIVVGENEKAARKSKKAKQVKNKTIKSRKNKI